MILSQIGKEKEEREKRRRENSLVFIQVQTLPTGKHQDKKQGQHEMEDSSSHEWFVVGISSV